MKRFFVITVLACLVSMITVGGVSALWSYTDDYVDGTSSSLSVLVGDFVWEGSEILPDEEEEGIDHVWLIQNLVDGTTDSNKEIGLNNPDSALNDYINNRLEGGWGWSRNYFGSMADGKSLWESLFMSVIILFIRCIGGEYLEEVSVLRKYER